METCPICDRPYGVRRRCYYCTTSYRVGSPGRPRPRTGVTRTCETCGRSIYLQPNQIKHGEGRYCSRSCKAAGMTGIELVTGTIYVRKDGYRIIKLGIRQYQLEHRLVAEAAIGRPLLSDEEVHHRNGDKLDNRIDNLEVLGPSEHAFRHRDRVIFRRSRVILTCRWCGTSYERKTSRSGSAFCSNACRLSALHEGNRKPA